MSVKDAMAPQKEGASSVASDSATIFDIGTTEPQLLIHQPLVEDNNTFPTSKAENDEKKHM